MMKTLDQQVSLEIRYEYAIKLLLDLGLDHSCQRAKITADVLLSANNAKITPGRNWPLYVPDLRKLHENELNAALGVIHGRVSLGLHPVSVIQNSTELFEKLWYRWHNVEEW
jgi:hypothetical protein